VFHRSAPLAIAVLGLALVLGGCDSFYRAIGKEKVVPDEFAVVSRAPLAVPPDFALRPPRIGAQRPQEVPPVDQARQTVFRAGADQSTLPPAAAQRSPGEDELLHEAGAANAPADIRQLVNTEATSANDLSDSFVDRLAFWRKGQKLGPTDQVIDPSQEAERLQEAKEAGKPPNAVMAAPATGPLASGLAAPPTIERTPSTSTAIPGFSWLGSLF
jgi:hypothetical protein